MSVQSVHAHRRGGLLRSAGWLSAAAMLALAALAPGAALAADPITPTIYTSEDHEALAGNHTCGEFEVAFGGGQDWNDSKLDKSPETGDTVVTSAGTITITSAGNDVFSWSSTFGIDAVFVKTGNGQDGINVLYVYAPTAASPEATVGSDLTDQGGGTGISHVSFCWDTGTPPTPTPPTPTPPTPTGSELPVTSEQPTPTGQVGGVIGTPALTPPATDAFDQGGPATGESWRIVLAGLAGLIATLLVFTQPSRTKRRSR